jgi:hypothetical protein
MRKSLTFLLASAAALGTALVVACGNNNNNVPPPSPEGGADSAVQHDAGTSDAPHEGGAGEAEAGTGCGTDDAGIARAPFTCCVMGLIDNHTNGTDPPDPSFCNGLTDNPADPAQFDKYF